MTTYRFQESAEESRDLAHYLCAEIRIVDAYQLNDQVHFLAIYFRDVMEKLNMNRHDLDRDLIRRYEQVVECRLRRNAKRILEIDKEPRPQKKRGDKANNGRKRDESMEKARCKGECIPKTKWGNKKKCPVKTCGKWVLHLKDHLKSKKHDWSNEQYQEFKLTNCVKNSRDLRPLKQCPWCQWMGKRLDKHTASSHKEKMRHAGYNKVQK